MFQQFSSELASEGQGTALILAGPNGAGKDAVAQYVHGRLDIVRVVRHITRPPSSDEVNGVDYHFVDDAEFKELATAGVFIEHASYVGCKSGTSLAELHRRLGQADFASLTANYEDGAKMHRIIRELGLRSMCFFVSPCSQDSFTEDSDEYLSVLRHRMVSRGRTSDMIEGRLRKAAWYRELYLESPDDATYVDNSDGQLAQASVYVARVALAGAAELLGES